MLNFITNRKCFLAALLFLPAISLSAQPSLEEANSAYVKFRVAEAKKCYEKIWADTSSGTRNAEAGVRLAKINWQFYGEYELAKAYTNTLLKSDPDLFDASYQMADIAIEAGKYDDARYYLQESMIRADNDYRKKITNVGYARHILARAQQELSGRGAVHPDEIQEAMDRLRAYYLSEPENLVVARLCLGLGLLMEEEETVLHAYRTYFRIPEDENITGLLANAEALIIKGLQSDTEKAELVRGLALSRFYDYSVMTMHQFDLDHDQADDLADIYHYAHFLEESEAALYEYFRQKALGKGSAKAYIKNYYTRCIDFWDKLSWENSPPVFYEKGFEKELAQRFGTRMNTGQGGMDIAFIAGHSVFTERQEIEQYGRHEIITCHSLDNIIGNIYPHWYFNFFGVGAWATDDHHILHIRTVGINGNSPQRAFYRITDERERSKWLNEIRNKSALDDSIARIHPYELLEGLGERMKFQCYSSLIDSLKTLHDDQRALKVDFLSCTEDILVNSVVFSHEERHILDSYADYPYNTEMLSLEEREFRANLSGIAFSPNPKLTLAENTLIPQDPAHENANRRIIRGLVDWMSEHRNEIQGLDHKRPLLPQLDLLTNDQVVRATRSIDPLYAKYLPNGSITLSEESHVLNTQYP